ncbi:hypothetical protein L596_027057 [Steinernema carpocapsae]|uniref:Uncharacterized protein n=1 Tax=Steinernema carpocapsae TaxID=34508 RepID=A0A4U5M366_STECR|nr:hypothetical protein L596_027057 [Steinernema carpocapsae]
MDRLEKAQEAIGIIATKDQTSLFPFLPPEIMRDIATQRGINRLKIKQLKGAFGDFANKLVNVLVDSEGAFVEGGKANRFQWTEASQLNGLNILVIFVKSESTPEGVNTLRLALRGWYEEVHVGYAEEEVLEEVFKDAPTLVPAKEVVVDGRALGPALLRFFQLVFSRKQDKKLKLTFRGCNLKDCPNIITFRNHAITAFKNGTIPTCLFDESWPSLSLEELKRLLDFTDFQPVYEEANLCFNIKVVNANTFDALMTDVGVTKVELDNKSEPSIYQVDKPNFTVQISWKASCHQIRVKLLKRK